MLVSSSERKPSLLIVDDDQSYQLALRTFLKSRFDVRAAYNMDEALAIVRNHHLDLVILDMQMRTPDEGLRGIPKLREINSDVSIVVSSGMTEFSVVREAIRLGALDYIAKESGPDELLHSISRVLEKRNLLKRQEQQTFEVKTAQRKNILIGSSPVVQHLKRLIERMRHSKANVVIFGETGAGKEVVARMFRTEAPDGSLLPFVAVDSATIHSETAESILFGHEKGAFTGADKPRKGVFEEANAGIVYFDELANMSLPIQAKLLRVIQEKEVTRLGSSRAIPMEFRVIAATNKNLESMVKAGAFKEDLFQRLNVLPINIPPLRERKEDIPELIEHFLSAQMGERELRFTELALEALKWYSWPGNIRELQNLISYLCAVCEMDEIDLVDLPPKFRDTTAMAATCSTATLPTSSQTFYERVSDFESQLLQEEFRRAQGNVSKLAEKLGMDRSHLYSKLKAYGIHSTTPAKRLASN